MNNGQSRALGAGAVHTQEQSRLFQLPRELRDVIYGYLFSSTRITHGKRDAWGKQDSLRVLPKKDRILSLLRTCRRIETEVGNRWLGQILFNFEDPNTMMTKLSALPIEKTSAIRHIRVRGGLLTFHYPDENVSYELVHVLKFLSGLQLDTLTVLAVSSKGRFANISYNILNNLVQYGQGWKELCFISQDSEMLGYAANRVFDDLHKRQPQPAHWHAVMESRDGITRQPPVTIYRSTLHGVPGSVTDEKKRVVLQQEVSAPGQEDNYGQEEEETLMTGTGPPAELMIVVKRGKNVDYEEKSNSPLLPNIRDIREDCPGMGWAEIRKKYVEPSWSVLSEIAIGFADSEDENSGGEIEDEPEDLEVLPICTDEYDHVDEYVWETPESLKQ